MDIEILKDNLCVNQIIGKANESIYAEDDIIIPDIKPDILSVINTSGTVCVYKKEIADGKIKIDGGVQAYIMYLADDENGNVRGINTVIDFSKTIEIENVNSNMNMNCIIELKEIECKILNGRKVSVKASLNVDVNIFSNENVEFVRTVENMKDIQFLNTTETMDSMLGSGVTKVYAKDTINIENEDNLLEIVKANFSILNKETKTSYNKILAKSDMQVNIVYLTEDNKIQEVNWQIPVMGFIDMQNISDDNMINVDYEIKNVLIKPNNVDEHSIYVEVELEILSNVFEKKEINIIQDLYSPKDNLEISQKNIIVMQNKQNVFSKYVINERLQIPELQNARICNTEVKAKVLNQKIYKDKIAYDGEVQVKFMYISSVTNRIDVKIQTLPFSYNLDCPEILENSNLNTTIDVLSENFSAMPDGNIETNIELGICADISKMKEINVIDNVNVSENPNENIYSIVVYFVKPGDTLWNIAKRFKSTINAIASVNGIEDENKINVGQQLFIPKFV